MTQEAPWYLLISIHAPAWGATVLTDAEYIAIWDFNPRSRMGSDLRAV